MPIPQPKEGEKQKDFTDRCMSDEVMVKEYPENDQRYAICMQAWRDKDKNESSSWPENIECRCFTAKLELRTETNQQGDVLTGYASVFNSRGQIGNKFEEEVIPGAFTESIVEDDIRALWNHNPLYVLGRNKAGTLGLWQDDHGLGVEIKPPDTQWARDLMMTIKRGDVNQMSFSFEVRKQEWKWAKNAKEIDLRRVLKAKLWDVGPATFPVYMDTSIALRAIERARVMEKNIPPSTIGLKRLRLRRHGLNDYLKGR